jgi:hypothetical protein
MEEMIKAYQFGDDTDFLTAYDKAKREGIDIPDRYKERAKYLRGRY